MPWVASVFLLSITLSCGHAEAQQPRQRIALNGQIMKSAVGLAKWSAGRDVVNAGEPGDLILLKTKSSPGEQLTVGAYLEARKAVPGPSGQLEAQGDWFFVPASATGKEWGYESHTSRSVGAWTRLRNAGSNDSPENVQVFLPYNAAALVTGGTYQVRYRIRVWSGNQLVDDFHTNEQRFVEATSSKVLRERIGICAPGDDGPSLCSFRLEGTDDTGM